MQAAYKPPRDFTIPSSMSFAILSCKFEYNLDILSSIASVKNGKGLIPFMLIDLASI